MVQAKHFMDDQRGATYLFSVRLKLGGHDLSRRAWDRKSALADRTADRPQQGFTKTRHRAADYYHLRIEQIDNAGDGNSNVAAGLLQNLDGESISLFGGRLDCARRYCFK